VNKRFEEIARRKQALVDQAARQRAEIGGHFAKLRSPFDLGGAMGHIGRALKARPMITVGASTLLVSGLAGKLFRGSRQVLRLGKVAVPLWVWWRRRKTS
jgi:hypothetical protein